MTAFSDNVIHSCAAIGLTMASTLLGTISDTTIWRCNNSGIALQGGDMYFDTVTLFGNTTQNITYSGAASATFYNATISGDTSFSTTNGITMGGGNTGGNLTFYNAAFSVVTGIKTAHTNDISFGNTATLTRILFINSVLGAATEISGQTSMSTNSIVASQKHDQTAGLHKSWKRTGTIMIDTTTTQSGGTSVKLTPLSATEKLSSSGINGGFKVAVASGQTCTPAVYVYEDGSYNGNRARLIVKRNDAMGITSDTVLDTATAASDAAWEQLTGTTGTVTDDGTLEFVVDCDGTAGNLFVDSFSVT